MDQKKGILVVSFGTSHPVTRAATIEAIEDSISKAFTDIKVYRAWTSKMIISKIQKNTMEKIPTVNEALSQMAADVFIQPTHVINGIENDIMKADALKFRDSFDSISFGVPLLSSTQDMEELVHIIIEAFPSLGNDEVLILMGHGSEHYANMAYAALDYMFKQKGYSQIYVGSLPFPGTHSLWTAGQGHKENPSGAPYDRGRGACHQ
jgi:sirohydrochlorin cobaltochelatase